MDGSTSRTSQYYVAWITFVTSAVVLIIILVRKFVHYKAECWFCCEKVKVAYFSRNSFTCPYCDQYNGFKEDGDYNKIIPSMYSAELNPRRVHTEVIGQPSGQHNFLCEGCHGNQIMKIQQLAAFVPYSEVNFEKEIESFQHYLEDAYKLCPPCQLRVNQEIQRQDQILGRNLEAQQSRMRYRKNKMAGSKGWFLIHLVNLMQIATVFVMVSLFVNDISTVFNYKIIQLDPWLRHTERHKLSLTVTGICLALLSSLFLWTDRKKKMDAIHLILWLMVLAFTPQPWKKLPIFIQMTLVKDGYTCIVSLLCCLMSFIWCYSHLNRSFKNRSHAALNLDEDLEGSVASSYASSEEGEEDEDEVDGEPPQRPPSADSQVSQPMEAANQRGPVGDGLNSLSLGPPREMPKKRNGDVWTSRIGSSTPPLTESTLPPPQEPVASRSVVHPARFNYTGNSPAGSAASSVVDGPTTSRQARTNHQPAAHFQRQPKPNLDKDEGSTSGIDGSSDEACTSISRRTRTSRKTKGSNSRKVTENKLDFPPIMSLFWAVLFGISIGINISAAIYFQSIR